MSCSCEDLVPCARRAWMTLLKILASCSLALPRARGLSGYRPLHSVRRGGPHEGPGVRPCQSRGSVEECKHVNSTSSSTQHWVPMRVCASWGSSLVAGFVRRDGQVGEEDRDGQHRGVQVVQQALHLREHLLPDLPSCRAHTAHSVSGSL